MSHMGHMGYLGLPIWPLVNFGCKVQLALLVSTFFWFFSLIHHNGRMYICVTLVPPIYSIHGLASKQIKRSYSQCLLSNQSNCGHSGASNSVFRIRFLFFSEDIVKDRSTNDQTEKCRVRIRKRVSVRKANCDVRSPDSCSNFSNHTPTIKHQSCRDKAEECSHHV